MIKSDFVYRCDLNFCLSLLQIKSNYFFAQQIKVGPKQLQTYTIKPDYR